MEELLVSNLRNILVEEDRIKINALRKKLQEKRKIIDPESTILGGIK